MRHALCAMLFLGGVMNSYLVRIYRKAEDNPRVLVGVVEEPGVKEKKAFSNLYELWDILNPGKREPIQPNKKRSSKRNRNMKQS
jgi:hypothetical protein